MVKCDGWNRIQDCLNKFGLASMNMKSSDQRKIFPKKTADERRAVNGGRCGCLYQDNMTLSKE
jgi:hypothetical protein